MPARPDPVARKPVLAARGVSKSYGRGAQRLEVLADVDFELYPGELAAIVGFSGSGKTTLLSILAGLIEPDAGHVEMDGAPAPGPGPARGVMFQSYALLPWLTSLENVDLAVRSAHPGASRSERQSRSMQWLKRVGLEAASQKRPAELSGGMRQRVSLARTLALEPRILLLDEPLGALDALTRGSLQEEIAEILAQTRTSAVVITNDLDEALLLGDRVLALAPGPRAKLGPSFPVTLPRPRERTALNRDPSFRKLRNELMSHLLGLAARRHGVSANATRTPLPDLRPIDVMRVR